MNEVQILVQRSLDQSFQFGDYNLSVGKKM